MSESDSSPPLRSRFSKVNPPIVPKAGGKTKPPNGFTINYGNQLQVIKDGAKSKCQWTIAKVIHESDRTFSPEALKGKPGEPFQPKIKHLCWLTVSHRDSPEQLTFTYALKLKSGAYKPTTLNQEKRIAQKMSYRNGVKIVTDKNTLDTGRLATYGNRLPRVGVLANGPSSLHDIGFISDRFAITQLGFTSYDDFQASTTLKFGERKPYVPKPLGGLLQDLEDDNDELSVEEEDEEELDEGDPYGDDNDDDNSNNDDASNNDDSSDDSSNNDEVQPSLLESAEEETGKHVNDDVEAFKISRLLMSGGKPTSVNDVISRTDMLRRMEEIEAEEVSGTIWREKGKRKPEAVIEKAAKKQKSKPTKSPVVPPTDPPAVQEAIPLPEPSEPRAASGKTTTHKASTSATKRRKHVSPEEVEEIHQDRQSLFIEEYTTSDFMEEAYPKICAAPKVVKYYTQPEKTECFDMKTTMHNLTESVSNLRPDITSVVVPFLYELFCKHYGKPVENPTRLTGTPKEIGGLLAKLTECRDYKAMLALLEEITQFVKTEEARSTQEGTLFELVDQAAQHSASHNHHDLLTLVFAADAKVRVGVKAHGDEAARQYIAAVKKNKELNIMLFNVYKEFHERTAVQDDNSESSINDSDGINFFD